MSRSQVQILPEPPNFCGYDVAVAYNLPKVGVRVRLPLPVPIQGGAMNFKRKKCKRNVKCTLCTAHRWLGNRKGRFKDKEVAQKVGTSGDLQSRC